MLIYIIKCFIFYISKFNKKGTYMDDTKTSYVIKDIDRNVWQKFRGTAILNGFKSAGACLRKLIDLYSEGKINETK